MSTRLEKLYKGYTKNLAYTVLGAYSRGAARGSLQIDRELTNVALGKQICDLGRAEGEGFNPLNIIVDTNNRKGSPEKLEYLRGLIEYGTDKLVETYSMIVNSKINEEKKYKVLKAEAMKIADVLNKAAYGEGMVDEELKMDIALILKEGKEKFEARAKEAIAQEAVNTTVMEAPAMEQPQDGMGDQFADDGFGDFDPAVGNQDMNDFADQGNDQGGDYSDLGFDQGFGEPLDAGTEQGPDLDKAANDMSQFNDGLGENFNGVDLSKVVAFAENKGFSTDAIKDFLATENVTKAYAEDKRYYYGEGYLSTMDRQTVDAITDAILDVEERLFNQVAAAEGVDAINTVKYRQYSKHTINGLALVFCTRHRLDI